MKNINKIILSTAVAVTSVFAFAGCSKTNETKELAKRIENRSTELIYSIESMDDIKISDLSEETTSVSASYVITPNETKQQQNRMNGANPKTNSSTSTKTGTASLNRTISGTTITSTMNNNEENVVDLSTNDFGDSDVYSKALVEKRARIMLLCSKLRKGEIKLTSQDLERVNECLDLIDSTSKYLESSKGSLEKEFQKASTTSQKVALREKLAIRQAKLQTGILAMDEIISIMDNSYKTITVPNFPITNTKKTTTNSNTGVKNTKQTNTKTTTNNNQTNTTRNGKNQINNQVPTNNGRINGTQTTTNNNGINSTQTTNNKEIKTIYDNQNTNNINYVTNNQQYTTRPRNVSNIYHKMPIVSSFVFPEKPPRAITLPYIGNV